MSAMSRLLSVVVVMTATSACTRPNPAVCCSSAADCAVIGVEDQQRDCALSLVCADHECSVPPDGPKAECTLDDECASPTPRCAPNLQCVECIKAADCPVSEPTCDATSHQCRACVLDADCTSEICDTQTGVCVPESTIVYASPSGTSVASCSRADRCSIQRAFAITDATRNVIKLVPGIYSGNLVVSNKTVRVRGAGATISSTSGDTLTVNDHGSLTVSGVIIVSAAAAGRAVICSSLNNVDIPVLALDTVTVESTTTGIKLTKCSATITQSTIHTTGFSSGLLATNASTADVTRTSIRGGAYIVGSVDNSVLRLTNTIVGDPTTPGDDGFFAVSGAVALSFSTVINARVQCNGSPSVCSGASTNGVCFDNSVVVNLTPGAPTDTVTGLACSGTYTAVFPQAAALAGLGNLAVNPKLVNPAMNDLHLQATSPAIDAANPAATLGVDFEGKPRPSGAQRDLGAFEYP